MNAMLTSRCEFSMIFEASATLIEGALCVPLVNTELYILSIISAIFGVEPEVTFLIFSTVCSL